MAIIIDGKALAKKIRQELREECNELRSKEIIPKLAVIMVGDNPASKVYVRNKSRACDEVGIEFEEYLLPTTTEQSELLNLIDKLNKQEDIKECDEPTQCELHRGTNTCCYFCDDVDECGYADKCGYVVEFKNNGDSDEVFDCKYFKEPLND